MSDLFVVGFNAGWDISGEGFNSEYCRPRKPWAEFWAEQIAKAREGAWAELLAANLAVAGGLCAAFRAGDNFGFHMGADEWQCTCQWSPGCGEPYRGWTRCEQDEIAADYAERASLDFEDYEA